MLHKKRGAAFIRAAAVILMVAMLLPVCASAAQPRASLYLQFYDAETYDAGGGKIQVWFSVNGAGYQDLLGVSSIKLYESEDGVNWTRVKTYVFGFYPSLMKANAIYHSGHVDYQGESGMYYKAYVTFFGGSDNAGDSRYYWTTSIRAA